MFKLFFNTKQRELWPQVYTWRYNSAILIIKYGVATRAIRLVDTLSYDRDTLYGIRISALIIK